MASINGVESERAFGVRLFFTRSEVDTTLSSRVVQSPGTVQKRLVLLRDYEAYCAKKRRAGSFDDFVEQTGYGISHSSVKVALREAKRIRWNARNGLFPGIYEDSKIKDVISFYSGGRLKTIRAFDHIRSCFPKEVQSLIPPVQHQKVQN